MQRSSRLGENDPLSGFVNSAPEREPAMLKSILPFSTAATVLITGERPCAAIRPRRIIQSRPNSRPRQRCHAVTQSFDAKFHRPRTRNGEEP